MLFYYIYRCKRETEFTLILHKSLSKSTIKITFTLFTSKLNSSIIKLKNGSKMNLKPLTSQHAFEPHSYKFTNIKPAT